MSRLWAKLLGRGREADEAPEPQQTVEVPALELEPVEPRRLDIPEVSPQPVAVEPEPEPEAVAVEAEPEPAAIEPEPESEPETAVAEREREPVAAREPPAGRLTASDVEARLGELLDSLGSAHRRPFVRNG